MSEGSRQLNRSAGASAFPRELIEERGKGIRRLSSEIRHHFSLDGDRTDTTGWDLDPFPRVLGESDWKLIRSGIIQRMSAFSRFVKDVYDRRRIVEEGILPTEVLLAMPGYHRQLVGLHGSENPGLLCGAVDLFRNRRGDWTVFENHFSFPAGISHVIQNRRMLAQGFPEVFTDRDVVPVAGFGGDLVEALKGGPGRRIVVLTRGDTVRPHFDDSFLARHMGIVSVRPADLIVREGRVFLKTIAGLEPIDVILRKVETNAVDPVSFPENQDRGVPGLVHCVREGTVRVVNVLGAEVADDRSILPFSDAIIRFYLGEMPLLPTVETFHCYDRDQAEWVSDRKEQYLFTHVAPPRVMLSARPLGEIPGDDVRPPLLEGPPEWTVARLKPSTEDLECWSDSGVVGAPYFLRVFGILGHRPVVLPGGLSWKPAFSGSTEFIGGMKDTWVMDATLGRSIQPGSDDLEKELAPSVLTAPSRVAEAIYWMARYLERARNAAHQAGLLESIRRTELAPADEEYYWPLWRGVASAAHFNPILAFEEKPSSFPDLFKDFVGLRTDPSSVASGLSAARRNLDLIQEWVPPEVTEVFCQLWDEFERFAEGAVPADERNAHRACVVVSREHARLNGVLERTLSHDAVYRFWVIGGSLEWAIGTTILLESILPSRISLQERHLEDDTDLTALLRLMGCLDAYRREYRSRAYLDRVIRMIWRKAELPGSFLFNLYRIQGSLSALERSSRRRPCGPLKRRIGKMIERVEGFPIEDVFPARMVHLDFGDGSAKVHATTLRKIARELKWLRSGLEGIHETLEDWFFSHQEMEETRRDRRAG